MRRSFAGSPTRTLPLGWNDTIEGMRRRPSSSAKVTARPSRTTPTTVFVVPRSIPTAMPIDGAAPRRLRIAAGNTTPRTRVAPNHGRSGRTMHFQDLIVRLQSFWTQKGCLLVQPYNSEWDAGAYNPATSLRALGPDAWNVAFVEPSRRPTDGRYGDNPNRLQQFHQYQVLLKPSPIDIQDMYLESLLALGTKPEEHDVRFVEDDWESPTLGAWGLGWQVWLHGVGRSQ